MLYCIHCLSVYKRRLVEYKGQRMLVQMQMTSKLPVKQISVWVDS